MKISELLKSVNICCDIDLLIVSRSTGKKVFRELQSCPEYIDNDIISMFVDETDLICLEVYCD